MSEYVRQELLDGWMVAHDKCKARAEAAERKVARVESELPTTAEVATWSGDPGGAFDRGQIYLARKIRAALADEETA